MKIEMNGKHKKFIVDVRSVYCHESGQEVKKASIADNAMLKEHDRKESKSGGRQGKERGRRGSGELGSWSSLTVKNSLGVKLFSGTVLLIECDTNEREFINTVWIISYFAP
ncbi:hypothetical protein LOAG_13995 [Loa loa]|uniref:Uncharacterized protein n=1 Tax=Loa loa TaxID=7209 RepID=A0A1S0TIC2_LOALO|nr:hypothetical protein LOAG_13995 [Loa loa]EFO14524.1 hypothetical protein LOAG_13995 [Loa loa]